MAIMPHCVICDPTGNSEVAGSVEFADYSPAWTPPTQPNGVEMLGWSNSLGVTAPEGVGLFCRDHLKPARKLRRLPSAEAVARLRAADPARGLLARLRSLLH